MPGFSASSTATSLMIFISSHKPVALVEDQKSTIAPWKPLASLFISLVLPEPRLVAKSLGLNSVMTSEAPPDCGPMVTLSKAELMARTEDLEKALGKAWPTALAKLAVPSVSWRERALLFFSMARAVLLMGPAAGLVLGRPSFASHLSRALKKAVLFLGEGGDGEREGGKKGGEGKGCERCFLVSDCRSACFERGAQNAAM